VRVDSVDRLSPPIRVKVADNQNSLKAGLRGPALLEDFILREKITHFDHERIPERIVHARGSAAHGYFECYEPLTKHTRASLSPGRTSARRYSCASRPSSVNGVRRIPRATCEALRQVYTTRETGTGRQQHPGVLHQDAMKFPDLIHAAKPGRTLRCPKPPRRTIHLGLRLARPSRRTC
jgi:catalase